MPPALPAPAPDESADPDILGERIGALTLVDAHRLARRLDGARRTRDPVRRSRDLAAVAGQVAAAEARLARRRSAVPAQIRYPAELPVSRSRDDIAAAIRDSQVVVLAGETGSGKTTQLPKICLDLGRGVRGAIGHTQPRRLAARTVADRVAEELGTPLGGAVGWKVRFHDRVGPETLVKVMTDGILLAEIPHDRDLLQYDTLIVDEAHERSLTIDFLLGYLVQLLPRRPDLKVVVTSATIDPGRFARHFGGAPVLEVSGRTYPVEVRYRPYGVERDDDRDSTQAILDAVDELAAEPPGDVLVFLSGEREIRDIADALRGRQLRDTEVLPLYARLPVAEQHRVFAPHPGRRIVLATNVAETSLTVPGIRYVVDPGTARISRYSSRLKVQRLPIEAISQASANQRAGRCGRVADGVCIRLYAQDDFEGRPAFTEPEVQRTNLASVILSMTDLGLGDVQAFPFLDPPDRRAVRDGVELLRELGAFGGDARAGDPDRRLTETGRRLAQLPVDPRLGRMVLEADRLGCVHEVLVITAALSIQDPRERPPEQQQAADAAHRRFADPTSDFLAYLNLWNYLQGQQDTLGSSAFRRRCRSEFLHFLRVREWQDVHAQLRSAARSLGIAVSSTPAEPSRVHTAVLAGLLSHIGLYDPDAREYLGARGARFAPWPGSSLARRPPAWVVAGELVETSRLWGRVLARIDPAEVEPLAQHLVKRSWSEPHWSRKQGAVMAYERVTLYGVPIVARRRVPYARVDPVVSRELFLRHALVEGDWDTRHRFFHDNRALLEDVEELENRARRRDIVVGDDELYDFYDARVPQDVVSARHFDAWWKTERHRHPGLLTFERELLVDPGAAEVSGEDYPDTWPHGDLDIVLTYSFEPGSEADGVTAHVPLAMLDRAAGVGLDWQVPGLRPELVTAMVRSLPKSLRRAFVPAPDTAAEVLRELVPYSGRLVDAVTEALTRLRGVVVQPDDVDLDKVPDHLRLTVRVEAEPDAGGRRRVLAEGKDLAVLQRVLAPELQAELSTAAEEVERSGLRTWTVGDLPRTVELQRAETVVTGYPALVDEHGTAGVRVLRSPQQQERAMLAGTRALLLADLPSPVRDILGRLDNRTKLVLATSSSPDVSALLTDCVAAAVDSLVHVHGGPPWTEHEYVALRAAVARELTPASEDVVRQVAAVLQQAQEVRSAVRGTTTLALLPALADVRVQLDALLHNGFVLHAGRARLPDLQRYLRAARRRLDVLAASPGRDAERLATVQRLEQALDARVATMPEERRDGDDVREIRWMLQELRVSLFAQGLGTAYPVSEKRVQRAIDALAA